MTETAQELNKKIIKLTIKLTNFKERLKEEDTENKGTCLPVQCLGSRRLSGGKQGVRRAEGLQ